MARLDILTASGLDETNDYDAWNKGSIPWTLAYSTPWDNIDFYATLIYTAGLASLNRAYPYLVLSVTVQSISSTDGAHTGPFQIHAGTEASGYSGWRSYSVPVTAELGERVDLLIPLHDIQAGNNEERGFYCGVYKADGSNFEPGGGTLDVSFELHDVYQLDAPPSAAGGATVYFWREEVDVTQEGEVIAGEGVSPLTALSSAVYEANEPLYAATPEVLDENLGTFSQNGASGVWILHGVNLPPTAVVQWIEFDISGAASTGAADGTASADQSYDLFLMKPENAPDTGSTVSFVYGNHVSGFGSGNIAAPCPLQTIRKAWRLRTPPQPTSGAVLFVSGGPAGQQKRIHGIRLYGVVP